MRNLFSWAILLGTVLAPMSFAKADTVTVSSPVAYSTVSSNSVHFYATAQASSSTTPITNMTVYVDYTRVGIWSASTGKPSVLDEYLTLATGTRKITVQSWNSAGIVTKNSFSINVSPTSVSPTPMPTPAPSASPSPVSSPKASPSPTPAPSPVSSGSGVVPVFKHVFIVVEENHSYSSVMGSTSPMTYFKGLASKYGLATNYDAVTHPSIGNYFAMTTGQIITNNDSFNSVISNDNIVRHLIAAGKTWKSYDESLPSIGYLGSTSGTYAKRHNPIAFFSDVANTTQKNNLVPFTQFKTDLANGALPNFSFIVPNLCNDAHDCGLATADIWLQNNIDPLIKSAAFQNDGLLIIVFDESASSDTAGGGGHVAMVMISSKVKPGFKSTHSYNHYSLLKTMMQALGFSSGYPGNASGATPMGDFF